MMDWEWSYRAEVERNSFVVAERVAVTGSFLPRLIGLLGRDGLDDGSGLLITPCSSIHTFFMRFAIDAVFVDKRGRILRIYHQLGAWRTTLPISSARSVLELPAGVMLRSGAMPGDQLVFTQI